MCSSRTGSGSGWLRKFSGCLRVLCWFGALSLLGVLSACTSKGDKNEGADDNACDGGACPACQRNRDCSGDLICHEGSCVPKCEARDTCEDAQHDSGTASDPVYVVIGQVREAASGATVTIRLLGSEEVVIVTKTNADGEIEVDVAELDALDPKASYVVEVSGGKVDGKKQDRVHRVVLSGDEIRAGLVNVTYVSEVIYVYVAQALQDKNGGLTTKKGAVDQDAVDDYVDELSRALLTSDLDGDGKRNNRDVLAFDPAKDEDALRFTSEALNVVISVQGVETSLRVALMSGDEALIWAVLVELFDIDDGVPNFKVVLVIPGDGSDDDTADDDTADDDTADDDTADDDTADDDDRPVVDPPLLDSFRASPVRYTDQGGQVTLTWSSSGADTLRVSSSELALDMEVTGQATTVNVFRAATLRLTASNAGGAVSREVSVSDWFAILGTPDAREGFSDFATNAAGDLVVGGTAQGDYLGPNQGEGDGFVVRVDTDGSPVWTTKIASSGNDGISSVAIDDAGVVYVSGSTTGVLGSSGFGDMDAFVARIEADGRVAWIRQVGDTDRDYALDAFPTTLNRVVFTGYSKPPAGNSTDNEAFIHVYDSAGALQWSDRFGPAGNSTTINQGNSDGAGNIYVVGSTTATLGETRLGSSDIYVRKYDAEGTVLWTQQLGSPNLDSPQQLALDSAGNPMFTSIVNNNVFTLWKLSTAGEVLMQLEEALLWSGLPSTNISAAGFSLDAADNIYLSGYTYDAVEAPIVGSYDGIITAHTPSGEVRWVQQFGAVGPDHVSRTAVVGDQLLMAGYLTVGNEDIGDPNAWLGRIPLP